MRLISDSMNHFGESIDLEIKRIQLDTPVLPVKDAIALRRRDKQMHSEK